MKRILFLLVLSFVFLSCNKATNFTLSNPPNSLPSELQKKELTDLEYKLNEILEDYIDFCEKNERSTTFEGFIEYMRLRVKTN